MNYHLAQINIAKMRAPLDSPVMADFVSNLDSINLLAEQSEGFIWRLKDEGNDGTTLKLFEDDFLIVNMSVWSSMDALFNFTYHSAHTGIFKRKREWFSKMLQMHMACWYVPVGELPSAEEGKQRLAYLNRHGETPYAFTFKSKFLAAEAVNFTP